MRKFRVKVQRITVERFPDFEIEAEDWDGAYDDAEVKAQRGEIGDVIVAETTSEFDFEVHDA